MKNKKVIYVLLPAVLVIWGLVIYRVLFASGGGDEVLGIITIPQQTHEISMVPDTFTIKGNYSDPFLDRNLLKVRRYPAKATTSKPPTRQQRRQRRGAPIKEQPGIQWPHISYNGVIEGEKKNMALIVISKQNHVLREGDVVDNIKLITIHPDSVVLELNGKKKAFSKR